VQAPSDPAIAVEPQLQAQFADVPIALQVEARAHGSNRKLSNLINMLPLARHDILIIADSDMVVGARYVGRVVALLDEPSVGAATCLYHGIPDGSISSRLAALAINTQFLPQVVTALRCGLAQPCFDATNRHYPSVCAGRHRRTARRRPHGRPHRLRVDLPHHPLRVRPALVPARAATVLADPAA
jgi:cellulose synthase/poly-beta-1,6-N-acetylglucosamine synthase-like glycosyltransferase